MSKPCPRIKYQLFLIIFQDAFNLNSGRRIRRSQHVTLESRLKQNWNHGLYHKFLTETKSSRDLRNRGFRIPIVSCMKELPFLKRSWNNSRWPQSLSIIIQELTSTDLDILSPSPLLEYYQTYCYCR